MHGAKVKMYWMCLLLSAWKVC